VELFRTDGEELFRTDGEELFRTDLFRTFTSNCRPIDRRVLVAYHCRKVAKYKYSSKLKVDYSILQF